MDSLLRDIRERDARDASRAAAPLKPAADAVILDTTKMTIDAAIRFVLEQYELRRSERWLGVHRHSAPGIARVHGWAGASARGRSGAL